VYGLLETLAALLPQPLDVILERDGDPPPWATYMDELARARSAVACGRAARARAAISDRVAQP
jgi:uncharacterized protein (UPF0276 family)